jgi:hypothetical protein
MDDMEVMFRPKSASGVASFLPEDYQRVMSFTTRPREVAESLVGNDMLEVGEMREGSGALSEYMVRRHLVSLLPIRNLQFSHGRLVMCG